jgi:hypothetical protein
MVGVAVFPISGTADLSRVEAPVTLKAYLLCAFAAFGGICECTSGLAGGADADLD